MNVAPMWLVKLTYSITRLKLLVNGLFIQSSIDLPPGLEDGQVLRVPIREDILAYTIAHEPYFYAYIKVEPDDYYVERDALDIYTEADLSVGMAVLGGELVVRGLHEKQLGVAVAPGRAASGCACRARRRLRAAFRAAP